MKQLGFSFDISRCSGCMACVVACMDQNDLTGNGVAFRHVTQLEKGDYPSVRISWVSLSCQNCSDAPCMVVCPSKAIFRNPRSGIVDVNKDACMHRSSLQKEK
jgi:Fe-S-cluster-containing dehydrogenase component